MAYYRRVVKKRPASLTDAEWLQVVERGKLPRPAWTPVDDRPYPPPDVWDLVYSVQLDRLKWRAEALWMAMQEPQVRKKGVGSSTSSASQGELLQPFSELWEFLSGTTYASGTPRQTGRLSLCLDADGVKVTLTDPSSRSYCVRSAASLDDALLHLEVAMKEGSLKWLPSSFANGKK